MVKTKTSVVPSLGFLILYHVPFFFLSYSQPVKF